ncbi:permease [Motiliproteus coralliicola]|uniref:Permease n=1 Tax=Motiliproteus coralliicola TaxID=2283196 RepID=A0A369W830_9GAMM|nr:permease [Motiliproteus coralliicola]RDE18072.1 permease [Motiliproteus coralliicola]
MIEQLTVYFQHPETQLMLRESGLMFLQLFTELTGLFLLISFAVSLINQKLPAEKIQGLLGARRGRGYLTAAGLGAVTPFCSCSTIPMLIGLLKARAGFGPTMTFLFTSPLLNPIVIALFIPVLGWQLTAWYAVLALVISIGAGALLQRLGFERYIKQQLLNSNSGGKCSSGSETDSGKTGGCGETASETQTSCCASSSKPAPKPSKWREAWQESWELFRSMFPYMLVAMLIGAFVHGFIPAEYFAEVASADNPAAIPTAALIGIPLYIRVTALLPLVAPFVAKGVSLGAIIALVIGSGGASLPEVILLKRLFYWPLLAAFLLVIFSMAVIGGFSFNWIAG